MKLDLKDEPRRFQPRKEKNIIISDFGKIHLEPDEMVSFVGSGGQDHDFVRKNWGFYATPSVNGRLKMEGFKTALVRNERHQIYIMVVEKEKINEFQKYCDDEAQEVLEWLDERPLL